VRAFQPFHKRLLPFLLSNPVQQFYLLQQRLRTDDELNIILSSGEGSQGATTLNYNHNKPT